MNKFDVDHINVKICRMCDFFFQIRFDRICETFNVKSLPILCEKININKIFFLKFYNWMWKCDYLTNVSESDNDHINVKIFA